MERGDGPRDEGARVGDEAFDEGEGNEVGSISLSGMGGDTKGFPETRMSMKRKAALYMVSILVHFGSMNARALDDLQQNDAPPLVSLRHFPLQRHLDEQLGEANQLERPGCPLVQ